METLEVKNFGPIIHASVTLKDINIFIGPSSSGKSTLARLCAVLNDYDFIKKVKRYSKFKEYLNKYNSSEYLTEKTYIKYESDILILTIRNGRITRSIKENKIIDSYNALYQYSKLSQTVDFEDSDLRIYEPIFEHLRILSEPIIKSLDSISYKSFYTFKNITHRASYIYYNIFFRAHSEISSSNLSNNESDDYFYEEEDFEGSLNEIEVLTNIAITYFRNELKELKSFQSSTYIPSERILFSFLTEKVFSVANTKLVLPQAMIDFGYIVEKAKTIEKEYNLNFIDTIYKFENGKNLVTQRGHEIDLDKAASGIQTVIPLFLAIEYKFFTNDYNTNFIIEEPELNLYPTNQKRLIEYIVGRCNNKNTKLTITTHSPYILTSINNFIQGSNAYQANPNAKEDINKIIDEKYWIDYERVAAYYISDGVTENIMDEEIKSIGSTRIDDVSEDIGYEFNELTDIIYS